MPATSYDDLSLEALPRRMADAAYDGDREHVLKPAAEWIRRFAGGQFAAVAAVTDGRIEQFALSGPPPAEITDIRGVPFGQGTVFVDDSGTTRYEFDDAPLPRRPDRPIAFFLALPLQHEGRETGLMMVTRSVPQKQFTSRERMCICRFAASAGHAIGIAEQMSRPVTFDASDWGRFRDQVDDLETFVPYDSTRIDSTIAAVASRLSAFEAVDAAHMYLPAADGLLMPTNHWSTSDPSRFERFRRATARSVFTSGLGLPGRVFARARPSFIADIATDGNFPRVHDATPSGIRSATAIPIRHESRVTAIVECFFTEFVDFEMQTLLDIEASVEANAANC